MAQRHAMLMSWARSPLPDLRQVGALQGAVSESVLLCSCQLLVAVYRLELFAVR